MAINDAVDWSRELGGGVRVALVQAGTFRSDAGTLFGPVPFVLWGRLVEDEIDESRRLLQALNCLLIETPAGRVLVETGIGERVDDKTRAMRVYEGPWIAAALETAGFLPESVNVVAMSHLHFDHAGGLLRADGSKAFPHATIVAQRAEWEIALGDNPRLVASYVQPELRLVEIVGQARLGRRREGDPAGRLGRADRRAFDGPPGDHRPGHGRRGTHAGVLRRPDDAAVGRESPLGHLVRRLPAGFGHAEGRAVRAGRRRGLDRRPVARGAAAGRPAGPRSRPIPLRAGMRAEGDEPRVLSLRLSIDSDEELRELERALVKARATELAEVRRQDLRHTAGYGDTTKRETMGEVARLAQLRHDLVVRLIDELKIAAGRAERERLA